MKHPVAARLVLFAAPLAGCTVTPVTPIPEPLPEASWSAPAAAGAFLGLKTRENDSGSLDALFFEPGVRVTRVVESSPAAEAGFLPGDVLLSFGEHAVNDSGTLEALVRATPPDETVSLRVQRGDTVFELPVTLRAAGGVAVEPEVSYRVDPARSRAGWRTAEGGVLLAASAPDAPFPSAGVPVGSVVQAVDGAEVLSARALIRALDTREPGERVRVRFRGPDGAAGEARVTLQEQPTRVTDLVIPIVYNYGAEPDGSAADWTLIDLWAIWLFKYEREGQERRWSFLRFFRWSTGVGDLSQ